MILQKANRIHELGNHVKSQLYFHSYEEKEVKRVHFQKLLPTFSRLLAYDRYKVVRALFEINSSETITHQLFQLFSNIGEIAKVEGGYYLPLPKRVVKLPVSNKLILLSGTINHNAKRPYIGIASGYGETNSDPQLALDEWLPSIDVQEFIDIIKNSQSYEITDEPLQVFIAKENRSWSSYEVIRKQKSIDFIAKFHPKQGIASYYWGKKRKDKISYCFIPNQYLDIAKYALENLKGIHRKVEAKPVDEDFLKIKFYFRIPETERIKLMLFAFPENFYDPFNWIVHKVHLDDFVYIINKLGISLKAL